MATMLEKFATVDLAATAAEQLAAKLLTAENDSDEQWAANYIKKVATEAHIGDCEQARPWQTLPMTCSACVYDEYMDKAWQQLGVSFPAKRK